ncbi:hypothetical protein WA026_012149 [Henosepilachna vigintioctopunctata]|uniref:Uncharacterized protein n=1 Tax=Henosepilachna vigintioctopunctata TaxID=420089 RepID=A0AAW1VB11_9CUCU
MVVGELFDSSKDSLIRLKETIKSPEIPFESSFRSISENSSSTDLVDRESSVKCPNVAEKPSTRFTVAPPILELERKTLEELLPSSYSKNEKKFECNFDALDDILDSTREEVEYSREENNIDSTLRNSNDFALPKSPVQHSCDYGTSGPIKGTKVASPILELERETLDRLRPSNYSRNDEKFECNFEILDNISYSKRKEVEYSRGEKNRGSTLRNVRYFDLPKSPVQDSCAGGTSSPTKDTKVVSPLGRGDRFPKNMSIALQNPKSLINEDSTGDQISSFRNFTSPGRNSPLVEVNDEKCGNRSTLEDSPTSRESTTHSSSPIRSPSLLDRSPSRREDYKQPSQSYRGARSPLNDSVIRNLSSPERICPSPMRSPSAGETRSYENVSPKSPNKIFNPFPVPLSSRQNKEVAVKLGLYKK